MGTDQGVGEGTRLAKAVSVAVAVIVVALVVGGFLMRDILGRLGSAERKAETAAELAEVNTKLLKERALNDEERTDLIKEVRDQAIVIRAQGDRLEVLANGQTALLEQVRIISKQVPDCFNPGGKCSVAAAAAAKNLEVQLNRVLTTVQGFQFDVQGTVDSGKFEGTARPTCQDTIGVGNQAVVPGLLCTKP